MTLRLGFVSLIRPLFKGDSPGAARRSLERLCALGQTAGFEVVTANVSSDERHAATGQPLPGFAVGNLSAAKQAAEQLTTEALDFLLIQHTTFATGELLEPLLHAAERVGVWALPESAGGGGDAGPLPLNALCGLNMTMSLLEQPQVAKREPVKWFYGEADSEGFRARLGPTLQALRGLKRLERARILQIGGTAPGFYGIEERPAIPGVIVETQPLSDFFERVAAVAEREVEARARDWAKVEPSEVTQEQLERAARTELALSAWAEEGGYDAIAVRCWPELPERCGSMACAAMGTVSSHTPAACEGDVMGALSMLALQGMSGQAAILMDLSDVSERDDALLFWHCGNAPLEWAANGHSRLRTHFNRDGVGVVRDMTLKPGPATGFRLLAGGREALIISGSFGERGGFDGVRGWLSDLRWNASPVSAGAFVANVLDYRLPHHFAFGLGELAEGLQDLCGWLGAKALEPCPRRNIL